MLPKKRRPKYQFIAAIVIVVGAVTGFLLRPRGQEPIIRTAEVERGTVTASVSANGILQPLTTVEVKSNVGGQIIELAVDEGDEVSAGQLIARIDPTDTQTAYEQSQADLAAAVSKVRQAREQLAMQRAQNNAEIEAAKQNLEAARARLRQAEELARVQPNLTTASIAQATSNLAAARAALKQTETALVPQKLAAAQAAFDQAKAGYETAQKDLERQRRLLERGFVSQSAVDTSEERFAVAKAQFESARRKLETVKDEADQDLSTARARVDQAQAELENAKANSVQVKVRQQELASAKAAVKQAEAALASALAAKRQIAIREGDIIQASAQVERSEASVRNAKTQLGYTTIIAPRSGVVTKKYVEEGSIITAGRASFSGTGAGVSIVDIADVSRMFALVSVDETDVAQIEIGQQVDVIVEAYPDEIFEGKVTKIAPQSVTEQSVTTIPVTVEIESPDRRLKPGMNVTCDFITGRAENVIMVPGEAVNEDDTGATVTVLKGEKQIKRKVEVGLIGKDYTEIKRGLKVGEKVVTAIIEPTIPGQMGSPGGPGSFGGPGGMRRRM
jgi:HlyD family secretion protein